MKLAWLCYDTDGDVVIKFEQPGTWYYKLVVPIVYAEIIE